MKHLLYILCLFVLSCDSGGGGGSDTGAEIDVDWILVKTPNYDMRWFAGTYPNLEFEGIGYFFYYKESSNITDLNLLVDSHDIFYFNDNSGLLSFNYNNENFSFNLNDAYMNGTWQDISMFRIASVEPDEDIQRIIYNQDMDYFTIFDAAGGSVSLIQLDSSSPNELIDYR